MDDLELPAKYRDLDGYPSHSEIAKELFDKAEALCSRDEWMQIVSKMHEASFEKLDEREQAIIRAWDDARLSADLL